MILHQAIRYLFRNFGSSILNGRKLFNLMNDFHFFDYEDSVLRNTFEIILRYYGEQLYNGLTNCDWHSTYHRAYIDCVCKFGFREDLTSYIFESISYGVGMSSSILKNYIIPLDSRELRLKYYLMFYQICGINILPIKGDTINWYSNKQSFKNPAFGNWTDFDNIGHDIKTVKEYAEDKDLTGIGGIMGSNGIRVLDFDDLGLFTNVVNGPWHESNIKFENFVKYCLSLLNLPEDYQWVVKSGSGCGFHIIFKTTEVQNYNPEIISFQSKKSFQKENLAVKALDLIWNGYVVLPPSLGSGFFDPNLYEAYPFIYRFYNRKLFPDYEPFFIEIGDLNNFLNEYCSEDHYYGGWLEGSPLYGNRKRSSEFGSFTNDYLTHSDSLEWLECCHTPEGLNMLAIKYIELKEFDKADKILRQNLSFSFSAYNYTLLMAYGHIDFSEELFVTLKSRYELDERISNYDKEELNKRMDILR